MRPMNFDITRKANERKRKFEDIQYFKEDLYSPMINTNNSY